MKRFFLTVLLALVFLPSCSRAQLVSEHYTVEGAAFNGNNTSQSGSSTNYTTDFEAGNLYVLSDATTPLVSTSYYGTKVITPSVAAYTFLTPTLIGPQSALVGSLVTLSVQVVRSDGVPIDPNTVHVYITIQGANPSEPTVVYRGFGVYQATYRVTTVGLDTIMATVNGILVQQDVDGVSDGILRVRVASAAATTPTDTPVAEVGEMSLPTEPIVPQDRDTTIDSQSTSSAVPSVRPVSVVPQGDLSPVQYPLLILLVAIGALSGFLTILLAYAHVPFSYTEITTLASHGLRNVFGLLTWQKRRRPWGTVYDSVTKAPIDPAYVQLFTQTGTVHDESITDLDGRYGFLVPDGTYTLVVHKTNYTFPSVHKPLLGQDVLYSNLYFGGEIPVDTTVVYDIPLDPQGHDWNQAEKLRTHQTHFFHAIDVWMIRMLDGLFYLGIIALGVQFYIERTSLAGGFFVGYLGLLYVRLRGGKPILYGVLAKSGAPLAYAIVHVLKGEYEVAHKVADRYGRYAILVSPGVYTVRIEERLGQDTYQVVYEHTLQTKAGLINMHVKL